MTTSTSASNGTNPSFMMAEIEWSIFTAIGYLHSMGSKGCPKTTLRILEPALALIHAMSDNVKSIQSKFDEVNSILSEEGENLTICEKADLALKETLYLMPESSKFDDDNETSASFATITGEEILSFKDSIRHIENSICCTLGYFLDLQVACPKTAKQLFLKPAVTMLQSLSEGVKSLESKLDEANSILSLEGDNPTICKNADLALHGTLDLVQRLLEGTKDDDDESPPKKKARNIGNNDDNAKTTGSASSFTNKASLKVRDDNESKPPGVLSTSSKPLLNISNETKTAISAPAPKPLLAITNETQPLTPGDSSFTTAKPLLNIRCDDETKALAPESAPTVSTSKPLPNITGDDESKAPDLASTSPKPILNITHGNEHKAPGSALDPKPLLDISNETKTPVSIAPTADNEKNKTTHSASAILKPTLNCG